MSGGLSVRIERVLPWVEPLTVAVGLADRDGALCLLSDPEAGGSRSFVACEPDQIQIGDRPTGSLFADLGREDWKDGVVVGLAGYDAGARAATGERDPVWPDLMLARYPAVLVFDHDHAGVKAVGWGPDETAAEAACARAAGWLDTTTSPSLPPPPMGALIPDAEAQDYRDAVAAVVERIRSGDLFQANIARGWTGLLDPGADPFAVFLRLARQGAAPYGAFWRIGDRAVVSNSPELFVTLDAASGEVETRPIKGTRARSRDAAVDAANAAALRSSAKDRAENLMIVDLMRNDLSRVCAPGSVRVDRLFDLESHPTVHHLVSTIRGRLAEGLGPADLLEATFPPGSITGAPKHQAMRVIAEHEPPRGAWCGSLFLLDEVGDLTASVLIRTAAFQRGDDRWSVRTQAGAGIVADSDPDAELEETEVKISALRQALIGSARA